LKCTQAELKYLQQKWLLKIYFMTIDWNKTFKNLPSLEANKVIDELNTKGFPLDLLWAESQLFETITKPEVGQTCTNQESIVQFGFQAHSIFVS